MGWAPSCLAFFSTSSATPFGPVVPSSRTAIFFALRSWTAKITPAAIFTTCCASTAGAAAISPSATATAHTRLSIDVVHAIRSSFGSSGVSRGTPRDRLSDPNRHNYGGAPSLRQGPTDGGPIAGRRVGGGPAPGALT